MKLNTFCSIILLAAFASTTASASNNALETAIRTSKNFQQIEASAKKYGADLYCGDFVEFGSVDLESSRAQYSMIAKSVVATCQSHPNDGGDAIAVKLLAMMTVTTNLKTQIQAVVVTSVSTVTPPQAD